MSSDAGRGRTRSWTFILYPDSAPVGWRDVLDDAHMQWVESPLHDMDVNADGEIKKEHLHILLMFDGVKTYEQVQELIEPLNATIPQKCHGARGLVRYMAHLDNPEKYQYDVAKIVAHGGADIDELLKRTTSERYQIINEMMQYCVDNNIIEMEDLINYSRYERYSDWFSVLCDNGAYIMGIFLKSRRFKGIDNFRQKE